MTPEEKSLLERTYKLTEENNVMIRSMRRANRFSMAMRISYWVLILVMGFGAYYLIQPYLTMMLGLYNQGQGSVGGLQGGINSVQNAATSLKELLK